MTFRWLVIQLESLLEKAYTSTYSTVSRLIRDFESIFYNYYYFSIESPTFSSKDFKYKRAVSKISSRKLQIASVFLVFIVGLSPVSAIVLQLLFINNVAAVETGNTFYEYDTESTEVIDSATEFANGDFSNGSFEATNDDVTTYVDVTEGIELNHYGSNPPDTSSNVWWDDDGSAATKYNWRFRKCFEVDNSASASILTDLQIYLDIDTATLVSAGVMLSDGDDIRFIDESGNELDYYIADDMNTSSTRIWVQTEDIAASTVEEICMYYGYVPYLENPIPANEPPSASDRSTVFDYASPTDIYYVVADTAPGGNIEFVSYENGNAVAVDAYSNTLSQYDFDQYPNVVPANLLQTTPIQTNAPVQISFLGNNGGEVIPVSFAGTEFVYRMPRNTNEFSFLSPWCSADVEVRNQNNTIVTNGSFTIAQGGFNNLTTNDTATSGIPNNGAVIVEVTNGCPILASHHATNGQDNFTMHPASNEWYGVASQAAHFAALNNTTNITAYLSDGTTQNFVLNRGDSNEIDGGASLGQDLSIRFVADGPIGVLSQADGNGTDSSTFLPVEEMDFRYYIPLSTDYVAIATREGISTTVEAYSAADTCADGTPDVFTQTVSPAATFPGKIYDGTNMAAGACIVANNPIYLYFEASQGGSNQDERNAWSYKQNRQFIHPEPTSATGTTQTGTWDLGTTGNAVWNSRIPIDVTNNATTLIDEYQIRLDLSGLTDLFTDAQSDGGDIRVAGALGDGTDNLEYWLESYDGVSEGILWFQTDSISATSTATYYIYFRYEDIYDIITSNAANPPLVWLDGSDATTIFRRDNCTQNPNNGQSVECWQDKSGNGNDFINPNNPPATKPTYTTGSINGLSVLTFDGGDYLEDADGELYLNGKDDITVIGVQAADATGVDYGPLETIDNPGTDDGLSYRYDVAGVSGGGTNLIKFGDGSNSGTASRLEHESSSGNQTLDPQMISIRRETGVQADLFINDTQDTLAFADGPAVQISGLQYVRIGEHNIASWEGRIAEFLIFDGALSDTDILRAQCDLALKWNITTTTNCVAFFDPQLTTTGDQLSVFSTSGLVTTSYVGDLENETLGTAEVIAFSDNTQVNDSANTANFNESQIRTMPFTVSAGGSYNQGDAISVTAPLNISYDNDVTDAAFPISFAGTEFAMMVDRSTDSFSFVAPFSNASVELFESTPSGWSSVRTDTVTVGTPLNYTQDITNNTAFRIVSNVPVLAFHRNGVQDSKLLYPVNETLEESGNYELWGHGSQNLKLAGVNVSTSVTIYRADNTTTTVTLDASTSFSYEEANGATQGDGNAGAYHLVADGPIAASSVADADGLETVTFLPKKEFSDTYALTAPAQYISVVTDDPSVTCRMFDATGLEVTTGTMDNLPPQTSGSLASPFPNHLHLGNNGTGDGAVFFAGYRMECTDPVYAYYEYESTTKTDETTMLTHPQGRVVYENMPTIEDPDITQEEGLYFESGRTGSDPVANWTYYFDVTSQTNGIHVFWDTIAAVEDIPTEASDNGVTPIEYELASGNTATTCDVASYGTPVNYLQGDPIPENLSDNTCLRLIVSLQTGNEAYSPRLDTLTTSYIIPDIMPDILSNVTISVPGQISATESKRTRIIKVTTNLSSLAGSTVANAFVSTTNSAVFGDASLDLFEIQNNQVINTNTYPPFPGAYDRGVNEATFNTTNDVAVYLDHRRSAGSTETISIESIIDINNSGTRGIYRPVDIEISGI